MLKPDCVCAIQRKRPQSLALACGGTFSPVRFGGQSCGIAEISSDFQRNACRFSLHSRLRGGGGSLALTFLCPNSLLRIVKNFVFQGPTFQSVLRDIRSPTSKIVQQCLLAHVMNHNTRRIVRAGPMTQVFGKKILENLA